MEYKVQEAQSFSLAKLRHLQKLVARGEGQSLEFKRKATHPEKIIAEFIAFANAQGGTLLVGIEDDGSILGLKHAEDDSYSVRQTLSKCKPSLEFEEIFIPISDNRIVIRYDIPESKDKPHYFIEEQKRKVFVRVQDKCVQASKIMCEVLRRSTKKSSNKFTYGDHEKLLMQYLELHKRITLEECSSLLKINKWKTSRKLILLVLSNVLDITPTEKGDVFSRRVE
jgi:hypothetical protein